MKLAVIDPNELKSMLEEIVNKIIQKELSYLRSTPDEKPLNQKEAAVFLGITQATLIKWKTEGKVPYEQLPGSSRIRFYRNELLRVVRQNRHLLQPARK